MSETPSIGIDEYLALPLDLRRKLDRWLEAEGLLGEHLTWFRLLEGAVEAERYVTDERGRIVVGGGEARTERRVYPILSAPPKEALHG